MAEEMGDLIGELLPLTTPLMEYLHRHFLRHFVEQDVIANMEAISTSRPEVLGQLRVAIAFADLVGFVRFTEEAGEEEALDLIERFVEAVEDTPAGRCARGQEHRRRRHDRRQRPGRADRLGDRLPGGVREALAGHGSASTTATPSIATATTTAERQSRLACRLARAGRRGAA